MQIDTLVNSSHFSVFSLQFSFFNHPNWACDRIQMPSEDSSWIIKTQWISTARIGLGGVLAAGLWGMCRFFGYFRRDYRSLAVSRRVSGKGLPKNGLESGARLESGHRAFRIGNEFKNVGWTNSRHGLRNFPRSLNLKYRFLWSRKL